MLRILGNRSSRSILALPRLSRNAPISHFGWSPCSAFCTTHASAKSNSKDKLAKDDAKERQIHKQILCELASHLWPSKDVNANAWSVKSRVATSLGLLVGSKLVNIYVPFLFKDIVDTFTVLAEGSSQAELMAAAPISLVLAYGLARMSAAGF
eukprot:gene37916-46063_t